MKECLVLFSGGKDSLLSTILLIEQGYKVKLVHYDNMCTIGCNNVKNGYKRLVKKYGSDKIEYIGTKNIACFFRNFINVIYNMHIDEVKEKYGNITISQLNCLSCRLSMYIASIIICKKYNIKYVADGARNSQLFAIEQDEMLQIFKRLFDEYNMELLFPVKNIRDDFDEKNQFIIRGIIPKVNESQCLLGMPLQDSIVDQESLKTCINIYEEIFKNMAQNMIEKFSNIEIGEGFI